MAETITVHYSVVGAAAQLLDTTEAPFAAGGGATLTHDQLNTDITMNASSSTDPVTAVAPMKITLASGTTTNYTATIDLTSMTGTMGKAVDFTGKKVQLARFVNPATNAQVTIAFGASNPYLLKGTGWTETLKGGQESTFRGYNATPAVATNAKTIDLTGSTASVISVMLAAG